MSDGPSTGYVDLGPGHPRYRISGHPTDPGRLSVFRAVGPPTLPPDVPPCGLEDEQLPLPTAGSSPTLSQFPGLKHIEVAVETDHEFFQLFGDTDAATAYLVLLYAEVSDIYMRDVDTRLELTFTRVWPEANDPFDSSNPLPEFRDYWEANMGFVERDVAQLLSGRRNYPFGGQAYLNGLCGSGRVFGRWIRHGILSRSFDAQSLQLRRRRSGSRAGPQFRHRPHPGRTGIDECHDPSSTPQRGTIMSYCGQTWSGMNANRGPRTFTRLFRATWATLINSSGCVAQDCNQNNIDDQNDIQQSTSDDVNTNGGPGRMRGLQRQLRARRPGHLLADNEFLDLNANGIPDECEPDCNGNNVPDDKDIARRDQQSILYGNDIPDECEADCDDNGISDYLQIQLDMPLDVDRNTVLDACQDCDGNGTTDHETLHGSHSHMGRQRPARTPGSANCIPVRGRADRGVGAAFWAPW